MLSQNKLLWLVMSIILIQFHTICSEPPEEKILEPARVALVGSYSEKSYDYFTNKNLYDLIDGGAEVYIKKGLINGFLVTLENADSVKIEVQLMRMKSGRKSKYLYKQFLKEDESYGNEYKGENCRAAHSDIPGGIYTISYLGEYYLEITTTGIDESKIARQTVNNLLTSIPL